MRSPRQCWSPSPRPVRQPSTMNSFGLLTTFPWGLQHRRDQRQVPVRLAAPRAHRRSSTTEESSGPRLQR
jgi:hypothetical protein